MGSILFADIALADGLGPARQHGWVAVCGSEIAYVGFDLDERQRDWLEQAHGPFGRTVDGRGKLLVPGFFNAHAHAPMTLLRGRGENLALDEWLNTSIFPFEDHIQEQDAYWATMLAIAEMARFGTVSFQDMYYHSDARARAVLDSGFKANLGHSITCFDPDAAYVDLPGAAINDHLLSDFHGAGDGRLRIDANLHAEYTSTPKVARGLAEWACDNELIMQVHVSETAAEVEACKQRHDGMTPVRYLDSCAIFDVPAVAAHCVWLEPDDLSILSKRDVTVAANPQSNAKLGSGMADLTAIHAAGIRLALGTDGVASNNNHDMHRGMYLMALFQRARDCSPLGLSSRELLAVATANGAVAQGRDRSGMVAERSSADLAVFDISVPWMQPLPELHSALLYSAMGSDVVMTLVDGQVVYDHGSYPTIDVERAAWETTRARNRILASLGEPIP